MIDAAVAQLAPELGFKPACAAAGRARATYYRRRPGAPPRPPASRPRRPQPRELSEGERQRVLGLLHSERFVDQAPPSVYATLLGEGIYLCSVPTMYRILRAAGEVRESGAPRLSIPPTSSPNCWPPAPIRCGRRTSPSCWVR